MPPLIFDYIKKQESDYETSEVQVGDNMFWNMRKHVQMIFHLKNGYFYTGDNDWMRAFKNIMEPILELSYWTEDLEVKDVQFFIEGTDDKVKSFLIKKYHDEVYTREHDIDTLFDQITECDIDYGGVLVQQGLERPEIIPLQSIAFCNQTDLKGGTLGFKYNFSPSQLRETSEIGWGDTKNGATISLEDLIVLATAEKDPEGTLTKKTNKVTTKNIEVYIVKGDLPEAYLKDNDNMEDYSYQVHVVAFYTDKKNNRIGVTLYRKKGDEDSILYFNSKEFYGRGLGRGIGERIIHPQIWTNFLTIHKTQMLQSGAKTPLYTDDPSYTQKNKIQDMENLEITTIEEGKRIYQVPTITPTNIQLYGNEVNEWYNYAQTAGAATDPLMGKEAPSGTTFRGQERAVAQGRGSHDKRRGQRAKFIEKIYRKIIIPDIIKEITKGKKFLATLSNDELTWVAEQMADKLTNKRIKEILLTGEMLTQEQQLQIKQLYKELITKKGNKQLVEILKDDFEDAEINIGINIANKQKNLADLSDKLLNIFQFIFANPQAFMSAMQVPALAKSFENLLEFSGMSIGDFSSLLTPPASPVTETEPNIQSPLTINSPIPA
jgi:hypothetical protein